MNHEISPRFLKLYRNDLILIAKIKYDLKGKEIAQIFGLSESTVSEVLKKMEKLFDD